MIQYWLLRHILFLFIATCTTTANVELQTQQGIIYGRQTQNTVEYLGYDQIYRFNSCLL